MSWEVSQDQKFLTQISELRANYPEIDRLTAIMRWSAGGSADDGRVFVPTRADPSIRSCDTVPLPGRHALKYFIRIVPPATCIFIHVCEFPQPQNPVGY